MHFLVVHYKDGTINPNPLHAEEEASKCVEFFRRKVGDLDVSDAGSRLELRPSFLSKTGAHAPPPYVVVNRTEYRLMLVRSLADVAAKLAAIEAENPDLELEGDGFFVHDFLRSEYEDILDSLGKL